MTTTRTRVRPSLLALLAALCVLLAPNAAQAATPAPPGNPLDGNAMWVWYTPKPNKLDAMIAQLKAAHMNSVLIKSGDGSTVWNQFNQGLVDRLHAAGLHVCAWHYVYGTHPITEARVSAYAYRQGAECMIIDAETEYEGRPTAARVYTRELRKLTSSHWLIGLSTFPYLKYHSSFPYHTFLRRGAATVNLPQMYWRDIGVSPAKIMQDTYQANRALGRPVYPIGQTWNNPGNGQLKAFQAAAKKVGARGVSWWDWSQTSAKSWTELNHSGLFITKPKAQPKRLASTPNPATALASVLKPVRTLTSTISLTPTG